MDEMKVDPKVKAQIADALNEPSAPEALVNRTVARVKAVEAGREALHELETAGDRLPSAEMETLAARCVVGELLRNNAPRVEVNGEKLAQQLREIDSFRRLASLPSAELIRKLTDGRTTGSFAQHLSDHAKARQEIPVIEAPVKAGPTRSM